jgi:hypothetical protein
MNDVIKKINNLNREEALESGQYVALKITAGETVGDREKEILKPLTDQPYANIKEIEELTRLVLLAAGTEGEYDVKTAIEGAGRKQFILGGAEIVVLAGIALLALQTIYNKGKGSETKSFKIEEENGKVSISFDQKTTYGVSSSLGSILKSYFLK